MASVLKFDQWQNTAGSLQQTTIQVVHAKLSSTFSATGASGDDYWVNVTGLSASITPKTTNSRIVIYTNMYIGITTSASGYQQSYRIMCNGSTIPSLLGDAEGGRQGVTGRVNMYGAGGSTTNQQYRMVMLSGMHIHSPSSTSTLTYSIQMRGYSSSPTIYVNRTESYQNGGSNYDNVPISTLTLMEIAA